MDRIKEILEALHAIEYLEGFDQRLINDKSAMVGSIKRQYIQDAIKLVEDNMEDIDNLPF
ncbi:MAG TPA: hypothetical protein VK982_13255 [Bacteroidales bacterium]|nr:hypothetical protein [Bacteroidales bacterium]